MKLKDFIETFSHNNEIWMENRHYVVMQYRYTKEYDYQRDVIMDWELKFTNVADCEVIEIANVIGHITQGITIVIDTEKEFIEFIPELVELDNCPPWLYEEVHRVKLQVGESC